MIYGRVVVRRRGAKAVELIRQVLKSSGTLNAEGEKRL
jgi:hypothetical protein